jgi:replicative DNA helicase
MTVAPTTAYRLPPQNLEAEQSVLGSIFLDNDTIEVIRDVLSPEDFYSEKHRVIYRVALELYNNLEPVDLVMMTDKLRTLGNLEQVGSISYLIGLADSVPTAAYAQNYARIVKDKSLLRQSISTLGQLMQQGYEADNVTAYFEQLEQKTFALTQKLRSQNAFVPIGEAAEEVREYVKTMQEQPDGLPGISSGLHDVDAKTGGLVGGQLAILAARPSMGKTALALLMALTAAKEGSSLVFSLEMSARELAGRCMSVIGSIEADKLKKPKTMLGERDAKLLEHSIETVTQRGVYIDDSAELDIATLRSRARQQCAKLGNVRLIVLDYLQIMSIGNGNPVQEYGKISRQLKNLSRELHVPILALSQLSRAVESRPNKRPQLSDLRESGALEQDADLVAFLYRDEYYNPDDPSVRGLAEFIIGKQRNGPVGTVDLSWNGKHTRFASLARTPQL